MLAYSLLLNTNTTSLSLCISYLSPSYSHYPDLDSLLFSSSLSFYHSVPSWVTLLLCRGQ